MTTYKSQVIALLKSIETGDMAALACISPTKYIQHNLSVADGLDGFGAALQALPKGSAKANVLRVFQEGDFVFAHTEFNFFGPKVGFDIFRFEDGKIVEHWDNMIAVQPKNPSGRSQIDGATEVKDLEKTTANKEIVKNFVTDILLNHKHNFTDFISTTEYLQHNPAVADGLEGFGAAMQYFAENGLVMEYVKLHQIHAEGNFVLTVSEGRFGKGELTSFYDLFRLDGGKIVEHWDVIDPIPPQADWKNTNGKF
jgi:predicted SnoaL-like aldol condensation-catalyzing enzyme